MAKTIVHQDLKSFFGDSDHLEVSQTATFSALIFESLSEKKPQPNELKIFELILNLSIDHGEDTPSAVKVIEQAKTGANISEAVAEGIKQINDSHGGAGENLMKILYQIDKGQLKMKQSLFSTKIADLVKEYLGQGKRIPGFGHRIYKQEDPRAKLILEKLTEVSLGGKFIEIARQLEKELNAQSGKQLPLNIDGAIAVALCSFGWEPVLGKAIFIIARTPGLIAHFLNNS